MNELSKVELLNVSGGESGWYYLGRYAKKFADWYVHNSMFED